jgi:hypothetical protein
VGGSRACGVYIRNASPSAFSGGNQLVLDDRNRSPAWVQLLSKASLTLVDSLALDNKDGCTASGFAAAYRRVHFCLG